MMNESRLLIRPEVKEAIRKHVEKSFPKKSVSEKEDLVREYCSKVMELEDEDGKISILQSRGFFVIDMEGNFVEGEGVYCDAS